MTNKTPYEIAIKLLTRQDYSRFKLFQKLKVKGFEESEIESALDKLIQDNFLREDFYREARIKGLLHKGHSTSFIKKKMEIENCPVSDEEILEVMSERGFTEDKLILSHLQKKARSLKSLDEESLQRWEQKMTQFLVYRGFELEKSQEAVRSFLSEMNSFEYFASI